MSSILDEIINLSQLQQESAVSNNLSLLSSMPSSQQGSPVNNEKESSNSEDEHGQQDRQEDQPSSSTQGSPDNVVAFTLNTARSLQLTTDGERSLFQFSQVNFHLFYIIAFFSFGQLDTRSALIYQQAMIIKLNEVSSRHEPLIATQGSDQLVLTDEIKVTDHNL